MQKRILIGIAGPSGSGKTYVANRIVDRLGRERAIIIQEDSYYRDLSEIPYEARAARNFDHPDAFDHDLLAKHLAQLLNGQTISQPIYDYRFHTRSKETRTVGPGAVIVVEGILVFSQEQLRELMDHRVYVKTPLDICFIRRLKRDVEERGRTVDSVVRQYTETVRPMYVRFVEPSKEYADVVIPGEEEDSDVIDTLIAGIDALLRDGCQ